MIRPFRPTDADALSALYHAAVHGPATAAYDAAQRLAWSPAPPDPAGFVARGSDGRVVLVAVDAEDRPIAYADIERDGHLDHFYCAPEVAGTGVSIALYEAIEAIARGWGLTGIHVEASEPARIFFLRRGFEVAHRRDFTIRGVAIHNYAMTKML